MRNLYRQLIQYSVEQRIKKLERQGQNFNREKIVKEMEAVNPIAIFMAFGALIWFLDDAFTFGMFKLLLPYLRISPVLRIRLSLTKVTITRTIG